MEMDNYKNHIEQFLTNALHSLSSPNFYSQIGLVLLALLVAFALARFLKSRSPILKQAPVDGPALHLRQGIYRLRELVLPLMMVLALSVSVDAAQVLIGQSWLVKISLSFAVIFMLYSIINRFVEKQLFRKLAIWLLLPIAVLHILGWLDEVVSYLETISLQIGNFKISAYGVARVVIFGSVLFWLGRLSNNAGQQIIRNQEDLDVGTREVFAKLFQVTLFVVVFLMLLQIMGINLTALAVFGGAVGVGLGFGLQSIASNFISGIIILMDRSLSVGDYIEMEDGRSGTIRELKMRSTTLETFDGKDIMVPNEQFITTSFTNWTHKNHKQRYSLDFQVAYKTDLHQLFELVREVVASHPQVISGDDIPLEERPDAEIKGFADSGIDILVEFWMEGIDDGPNRVGADLLLMIWDVLQQHGIEIPFPQREIKVLNQND